MQYLSKGERHDPGKTLYASKYTRGGMSYQQKPNLSPTIQLMMMILFYQIPRLPPATNSTITVEHRNQQIEVNLCHFYGNLGWFCPSFFSSEESLPLGCFCPSFFSLKWELCLTRWWWPLSRWRLRSTPSFGVFSPPFCRSFTHNQDHFKLSAVANDMIEQCP